MSPQELYEDLVAEALSRPGVSTGRMLRSEGLKVNGKVFALFNDGRLVVKLPAARAAALVAAGEAVPFESGGRKLREWVAVDPPEGGDPDPWRRLMADAAAFVRSP